MEDEIEDNLSVPRRGRIERLSAQVHVVCGFFLLRLDCASNREWNGVGSSKGISSFVPSMVLMRRPLGSTFTDVEGLRKHASWSTPVF